MNILTVASHDNFGGAAKAARDLHLAYRDMGHASWMAVGERSGAVPHSLSLAPDGLSTRFTQPNDHELTPTQRRCRARQIALGIEDFHFPRSRALTDLPPDAPQVVHAHNLHRGYFDLRALPELSRRMPVFLTLHDAWLLAGNCAYPFDCERWRTGCGQCPDPSIYPGQNADATAFNWRRKRRILSRCALHVSAPCAWLLDMAKDSLLAGGIAEARVIPYGLDLGLFQPGDQALARRRLRLPEDRPIVLMAAVNVKNSRWKDFPTLRRAVSILAGQDGPEFTCVALGAQQEEQEDLGRARILYRPFVPDPPSVAAYHQAADVYAHATRQDTFPNVVLEALACARPVEATAVCGIPEQVRDLASLGPDRATGMLCPPQDPQALARALATLLADAGLREALGRNARQDALKRFDLRRQAALHLDWYARALAQHATMP